MKDQHEKDAFLDAIAANRYDGATRKVFADWLEEHGEDDEALVQRAWTPEKQQAEDWLTEFAVEFGMSYEDLLEVARHFLDTGEGHTLDFDTPDRAFTDMADFWKHFGVVTGREVSGEKREAGFFRCAC